MASTIGTLFRVTTFGESHGRAVGAVVDGCPAGLELSEADVQAQLDRRRPGQSELTSPRQEADAVTILSGLEDGRTLGSPIALLVHNRDQRPQDYAALRATPRPSHADFTYQAKYGLRAGSGGGRASARETVGRVAAGAVAEAFLRRAFGVEIVAWVQSVGPVEAEGLYDPAGAVAAGAITSATVAGGEHAAGPHGPTRAEVDRHAVRCPDLEAAVRMAAAIEAAREAGDSVGGTIACICRGVPPGWGEPVIDKLEALLARAMLSIPACKGFEIGSGFAGARLPGSRHNDPFVRKGDRLGTRTNHSGGVQGGISNGEPVLFRVAFKPPATIAHPQQTADFAGREVELAARGRHDPCVLPRAVPIVEAMAALVLADLALAQRTQGG